MTNMLSMRLRRLERSPALADPYTHLSDDQLGDRIKEIDRAIEAASGMSVQAYARMLEARMLDRELLQDGISEADGRRFIAAIRNLDEVEPAHVR